MIKFLKNLFQGSADAPAKQQPPEAYDGFDIIPAPRKITGGWSTEAVIRKVVDGETKQHTFIRADSSVSQEAAVALIISKAKTLIDQQGDKIFR